jgi:hypothetical protein
VPVRKSSPGSFAQPREKVPSYGIPASSAARIVGEHNMSRPKVVWSGAGEGNRTLVISLEGVGTLSNFTARSDKTALFGAFEPNGISVAVRMPARCARRSPALASHRRYLAVVGLQGSTIFPSGHKLGGRPTPQDEER